MAEKKKAPPKKKKPPPSPPPEGDPYDLLWVEKYRPTTLDELALAPEVRKQFETYLEKGQFPPLLLHGPAGTGKTTLARILTTNLDCTVMTLNASSERGIDVIREKVGRFARTLNRSAWNVVFLDEADKLTADAQTALRNDMETYSSRTRFILTCNFLAKIIDPIQSRCTMVEMSTMPLKERFRILSRVLTEEGVQFEVPAAFALAEQMSDMRRLIMYAQSRVNANGDLGGAVEALQTSTDELWSAIGRRDWIGIVNLSKRAGFDHQRALSDLFWAVPENADLNIPFKQRLLLADAVDQSNFVPDRVIHFLGACLKLMEVR